MLSTGRFYLAPALWPLRPRVPRIYVFRVMLVSLPGAEARARGSPGRVTTLCARRLCASPASSRVRDPRRARRRGATPVRGVRALEPSGAPTLLRAPAARADATRLAFYIQDAAGFY